MVAQKSVKRVKYALLVIVIVLFVVVLAFSLDIFQLSPPTSGWGPPGWGSVPVEESERCGSKYVLYTCLPDYSTGTSCNCRTAVKGALFGPNKLPPCDEPNNPDDDGCYEINKITTIENSITQQCMRITPDGEEVVCHNTSTCTSTNTCNSCPCNEPLPSSDCDCSGCTDRYGTPFRGYLGLQHASITVTITRECARTRRIFPSF